MASSVVIFDRVDQTIDHVVDLIVAADRNNISKAGAALDNIIVAENNTGRTLAIEIGNLRKREDVDPKIPKILTRFKDKADTALEKIIIFGKRLVQKLEAKDAQAVELLGETVQKHLNEFKTAANKIVAAIERL